MLVHQFLEQSATRFPDKTALIAGDATHSYRELDHAANRLAHALVDLGLERGDRVAILLDNSPNTVIALFAVMKAGGVFMVLNPTTKAEKLDYILGDSRAAILITDRRRHRVVQASASTSDGAGRDHLRAVVVVDGAASDAKTTDATVAGGDATASSVVAAADLHARFASAEETPPTTATISVDLAALIYTSGSTGEPKGVMLTHRAMHAAALSVTTYLENVADDIILCVLPLSFDYGLYQALMSTLVGATVVLEKSFAFPHAILSQVVKHRVTGLPLVPTMSAILLDMDLSKYDFSALRYLTNTAAALPTEHITKLRERLPHVDVFSMYGLTECKRVSYLPKDQIDIRPDSVGIAIPDTEVFVLADDGEVVPPNTVGELVIRGAHVMSGYWGNPAATQKMLRPGRLPGEMWLYTGDLFRTDDDGFLYFVGRTDDIIKCKGEKVPPREIENVLYHLEGVHDAVVFGVPDNVLGEKVVAFVAKSADVDLDAKAVLRHCRMNLEDFMVPGQVEIRDELPKNPSGKIDKKRLRRDLLATMSA